MNPSVKNLDKIALSDITMFSIPGEIITHTGKWFDVFNPKHEDVDLEDIAHSESMQCRFTGHTKQFYSVAQHSVLVSQNCPSEYALAGLMHDASEAYLSDIARPIKKHPDFGPFYLKTEEKLQRAIFRHFGIPFEYMNYIHKADDLLLKTEARDLMPASFPVYPGDTLIEEIIPWTPRRAKN